MLDLGILEDDLPSLEHTLEPSSSTDKITQTSRALTDHLFGDWHELKNIIENHDELIRKRWRNKTRDQKKSVLLEAWGHDMSECHRPDLSNFIDAPNESSHSLDAYKWPSINLEDLLRPGVLPTFILSRGSHHPYLFCHADLNACALGISAGKIRMNDVEGRIMLVRDNDAPQNYARVFPESDAVSSDEMTGSWFRVGEALLILEIQQRIWHFLLACARIIAHGLVIDSAQGSKSGYDLQSSPLPNESAFAILASSIINAPYQIPARLDLSRLESLVSAKRSATADHIWLLREDPSYFADCVNDWKEHQPEMLLDAQGKKHPIHKAGLTKAFWNRVLRKMIIDSYLSISLWDYTHQEVCKFDKLLQKYPDPSPLQPLPEEIVFSIKKIRHLLELLAANSIALLKSHVPPSPPMVNYWHREGTSTADHHSSKFRMIPNPRNDHDPALDRLFWVYTTLWDDKKCALVGLRTLVCEVDRLTYAHTRAKDLQSALVVDNIGDLGVISECLHELSLYHPWSRNIEQEMTRNKQQIVEEFYTKSAEWENFRKMSWQGVDLADLGSPGDGRFSYPISNRRTKTNASALCKAEFHLDAFWSEVDKHLASQSTVLPDKIMRLLLSGNRFLQRTPEWEEPATVKPKGKTNGRSNGKTHRKTHSKSNVDLHESSHNKPNGKSAAPQQKHAAIDQPLSSTYLQLRGSHKRQTLIQVQEAFPATREASNDLTTNGYKDSKTEFKTSAIPRRSTFIVDKRSKKTFAAIFYTPSSNDTPGDTTWTDFVHALLSIDFVVEKLFGSVWHFAPPESVTGEHIQFHAPHAEDKVRYYVARLIGRRLYRAYGWTEATFVVNDDHR
ncbi:hypothetical protein QM012_007036 [Aureobasidium pullulans]|uniref:Fungal-type protein kinase domain-containing protein n=1 Tax=Aureobasidium pullulans TaxID=5580 RepID=A0ABR0TMD2_AURPU